MKQTLFLLITCIAFSVGAHGQLAVENTSGCDVNVTLYYAQPPSCTIVDSINFVVSGNSGSFSAVPPSGYEFVRSRVRADSCTSNILYVDPDGCIDCPQMPKYPSEGEISTSCRWCEDISFNWLHCDNHYVFY